ncbi:MAG: GTP cyclohydrolase I, partial [Ilumatobacteraceae bacterium]
MSKIHTPIDTQAVAVAVRALLIAIGENPDRNDLIETPARVARSYAELLRGYLENPVDHLKQQFDVGHDDLVIVRDIPFSSLCEHH